MTASPLVGGRPWGYGRGRAGSAGHSHDRRHAGSRTGRALLIAPLVVFAALFPVLGGLAGVDISGIRGLLQRLFALTVFLPIAGVAFLLIRALQATRLACPRAEA